MSAKYRVGQVASVSTSMYGPFTDKITSITESNGSYFYKFENHDGWNRGLHEYWIDEVVEDVETKNRRFKVGDIVMAMDGEVGKSVHPDYKATIVKVVPNGYHIDSNEGVNNFFKSESRVYALDEVNTPDESHNLKELEKLFEEYGKREKVGDEYIYSDVYLEDTLNGQYSYDLVIVSEDGKQVKFVSFSNSKCFYADFVNEEKVVRTTEFRVR